jgi:hypothetical protein
LKRKHGECATCLKNFVHKFVEKIYKMGLLEGGGVPVLYIGGTVPYGYAVTYPVFFLGGGGGFNKFS